MAINTQTNEGTEVRIPFYDRDWTNLDDVIATLKEMIRQLELEDPRTAEPIFIERKWEEMARNNSAFQKMLLDYGPTQLYLFYERT